jgi:Xaa-Pro aminopeptidase
MKDTAVKNLVKLMQKDGFDAYAVTNNTDQKYLTGFTFKPGEAILLISVKGNFCFTRELYMEVFPKKVSFVTPVNSLDYAGDAVKKIKELKLKKTGFSALKTPYAWGKALEKAGGRAAPAYISALREVKSAEEIAKFRHSCAQAYKGIAFLKKIIKTGVSEFDVRLELDHFMGKLGATGPAFDAHICFGKSSAEPHHSSSPGVRLKKEDAVLVDFGYVFNDYVSDISRSWWHGDNPPAEYVKINSLAERAKANALKNAGPAMTGKQIDALCRDMIKAEGYGKYFVHRTGHGMGLEVHETNGPDEQNNRRLPAGSVFSIEPGIYLPGKFGVRTEDTVLMTAKGAEALTVKGKKK